MRLDLHISPVMETQISLAQMVPTLQDTVVPLDLAYGTQTHSSARSVICCRRSNEKHTNVECSLSYSVRKISSSFMPSHSNITH